MNNSLEFFQTIISVLFGGLITYGTIIISEKRKDKKDKKENKKSIYRNLICSIKSIMRYEIVYLQENVTFKYHKRICDFEKKTGEIYNLHKEQAHYHQREMSEYFIRIIDTASIIDKISIDYHLYYGDDEVFDSLMTKILHWNRPYLVDFNNYDNLDGLNLGYDMMIRQMKVSVDNDLGKSLDQIITHIKTKI